MIFKLFSERKKEEHEAEGDVDVYSYDDVSQALRVQTQQILSDAIGRYYSARGYDIGRPPDENNHGWNEIVKILRRELGVHHLRSHRDNPKDELIGFLTDCSATEFVDAVEVCCRYIDIILRKLPDYRLKSMSILADPGSSIDELNYRIRKAAFGYQYEGGQFVRVDDEFAHREIVKPTILFLQNPAFGGAREEFLEAHRAYRDGKFAQSIIDAAKAFESALKCACQINGWDYPKGARATDLLKTVRKNGLFPPYLDNSFDQLVATLASGLPQLRNNQGAHGQGPLPAPISRSMAEYALNLSASKILLIGKLAVEAKA
ncbi:MAG: hypothetical protein WBA51_03405 [Erythrobacter sp.]